MTEDLDQGSRALLRSFGSRAVGVSGVKGHGANLKADAMKPAIVAPPSTDALSDAPASRSSSFACVKSKTAW